MTDPKPISTVYISGPMRGLPRFNFPAFDRTAAYLRSLGFEAVNPAEHDREMAPEIETWPGYPSGNPDECPLFDYHAAIRWDLQQVAERCDGIVMLPGWEHSVGAGHERYVAEACGLKVGYIVFDGDKTEMFWEEPCTVVGLAGYAQVGKDTVGNYLVEHHNFIRISFADALKDLMHRMNPMIAFTSADGNTFYSGSSSLVDKYGWEMMKRSGTRSRYSTRAMLQRLGTAAREVLGDDVWVETAMRQILPGGKYVFTDVRFPNEADAIRKLGGAVVRVVRQGYGPVNDHPSETALDAYKYDLLLRNDSTLELLYRTVDTVWGDSVRQYD